MSEQFEKHARTLSIFTFVSRITGLVRDAALASVFGITPFTDAFNFAFQIPNLFRRLFGEGAISAAFIPRYTELLRDDPERARKYCGLLLGVLATFLWLVVLVGELVIYVLWSGAPQVEYTVGNMVHVGGVPIASMSVRYARFAYELAAIMLPYMPLICIVAVGGSALQAHGRFGPTAGSPIILNLLMIAAMLGLTPFFLDGSMDPATHLRVVACAVIVAGILQVSWTLFVLRHARPVFAPHDPSARASVRATLRSALPMLLGLGVLQINIVVDGIIASWPSIVGPNILGMPYPLAEGAMTAITNASRLYEFPLGVFGISIAMAIFPALSRQNNDLPAFTNTLRRGLRLSLFIGLPASVGLMLVAREAVGVLFQRGEFGADDTARVAWVLVGFAPAIWAYQAIQIFTRAFYALKETMRPVKIAVAMVALNVCLNIALIFTPLREAGLAWSTAICAIVQAAVLAWVLVQRVPGFMSRDVLASWMRSVIAAGALLLAIVAIAPFVPAGTTWMEMAIALASKIVIGTAAFVLAARAMAMPELGWALGRSASSKS